MFFLLPKVMRLFSNSRCKPRKEGWMDGWMKSHSFENLSVVSVALSSTLFLEPGLVFREGRTEWLCFWERGR